MKKIVVLIILLCISLFAFTRFALPEHVLAAGEFRADYDVQYAIAPSGTTIVTQNITLTNNKTNLYPQKYSIVIGSEKIKNVIAFDNHGQVIPEIIQSDGKTNIMLAFNDKVVGLGKQLHFSLRYEDLDIAHKNGRIWEVNIPSANADDPDLASYTVTLRVPPTFGKIAYMSPPPAHGDKWDKDQMIMGGISAAYGDSQVFSLDLTYFVENPNVTPRTAEIALPPDTAFQHVSIQSIDPKPKNVVADADGNWMAQYDLLPAQSITVHAKILILITLSPRTGIAESMSDPAQYTKPVKYWESDNKDIQALARNYKTPREIYTYVTHALTYDYNRVNSSPVRKGAVAALSNPKNAICMEFTDLFVAIARAAGIPAREVIGFAYTTNAKLRPLSLVSDVLHAWPEYYDNNRNIWIPVDPTWANTTGGIDYFNKLDFNHIAFAIQGQISDYPYPAGFYKQKGSNSKDVRVTFIDAVPQFTASDLTVHYQFADSVPSGLTAKGNIVLENQDGIALPGTSVSVRSLPFDVNITKQINGIPPLANIIIPVSIPLPGYFMNSDGKLTTTVNGQTSEFTFHIEPLLNKFLIPIVCVIIITCILLISFLRKKLI